MRFGILAVLLSMALLIGLRAHAAGDATVRIVVTNEGADVGEKAAIEFYTAGTHTPTTIPGNMGVAGAAPGEVKTLLEGAYDIRITFADGNARKVVWLDKETLRGSVTKTVELAVPMAELLVAVTNDGADAGSHAAIHVYPAGAHTQNGVNNTLSVGEGEPGQPIRLAAGNYDVRVAFADSGAEKTVWLDNLALSGVVRKDVEIGLKMTELRFIVTNGGNDAGGKGDVRLYPAGSHARFATANPAALGWGTSGQAIRLPAGTYDARVRFEDGDAQKDVWFDNQTFSGLVERTVEVGVDLAQVRILVTNGGVPVKDQAQIGFYKPGRHEESVTRWTDAGAPVRLPPGTYDIRVRFADGSASKDVWLNGQAIAGTMEQTVEVGISVAEVRYTVLNNGAETGARSDVQFHPHGHRADPPVGSAHSGVSVRLPQGSYDVHILFADGETRRDLWLDDQAFSGVAERTVEVGVPIAEVHVIIALNGADTGARGEAHFYRHGQRSGGSVGWIRSGQTLRVPEGAYDVRVTFADGEIRKNVWLDDQTFAGSVERTVEVGGLPNLAR